MNALSGRAKVKRGGEQKLLKPSTKPLATVRWRNTRNIRMRAYAQWHRSLGRSLLPTPLQEERPYWEERWNWQIQDARCAAA
jgi:hypothetical protein